MSAKHTPGPFQTEYNTIFALMHHEWRAGVEKFRNRFWANVHFDNTVPNDERKATMDLLKSAPELLEALKVALPFADDVLDGMPTAHQGSCNPEAGCDALCADIGYVSNAVGMIRAAIAKAEGRAE